MYMRKLISSPPTKIILLSSLLILVAAIVVGAQSVHKAPPVLEAKDHNAMTVLQDLNRAYADIANRVRPAVVMVSTDRITSLKGMPFGQGELFDFFFHGQGDWQQPKEREFHQKGLGSGVIMSADGLILTNNHVVDEADSIFVRTIDGTQYTAKVLGVDPETDIAVIKIPADHLAAIEVGNSDDLHVGEIVLAVGSPMSENLAYTVTQGIVSAKGRSNVGLTDYEDFIQTDAAINPGNSGGPLVNVEGELVGINTAIASRSGGNQGIGFAVPSNMAVHVMNSLVDQGKVVRGWLGVSIQDISDAVAAAMSLRGTAGALVGDVLDGSPADHAGLQPGDVITAVDGQPVTNAAQLRSRIASDSPGTRTSLAILRDGDEETVKVTLGERPGSLASSAGTQSQVEEELGFSVGNLTGELAERYGIDSHQEGVVVTSIDPSSHAAQSGLREGDLILAVNREPVANVNEFNEQVTHTQAGDVVMFRILRDEAAFFLAFPAA
jgi:serine protease Do